MKSYLTIALFAMLALAVYGAAVEGKFIEPTNRQFTIINRFITNV